MVRARALVVVAPLGLSSCGSVSFGDPIVGWAFVAGLVLLFLAFIFFSARRQRAAGRRWLETVAVGRTDLATGTPAPITFTPRAGLEHALWLDLDTQGTAHRFELALTIQMDGATFFDQTWPSGIDSDDDSDHSLVPPPGTPADPVCFNVLDVGWRWRAVYRLMKLVPQTSSPVTISARLVPSGDTLVRRAHAVVTLGRTPP